MTPQTFPGVYDTLRKIGEKEELPLGTNITMYGRLAGTKSSLALQDVQRIEQLIGILGISNVEFQRSDYDTLVIMQVTNINPTLIRSLQDTLRGGPFSYNKPDSIPGE